MRKIRIYIILLLVVAMTSCSEYTYLYKSNNYRYKYEVAKTYYALGKYTKAYTILEDVMMQMKGTSNADELLYLLGCCYRDRKDYSLAATYFQQYYTSYPYGALVELARYQATYALYMNSPETRLDQADSYSAIQEAQIYLEYYPTGKYKEEVEKIMYALQDKLAEKQFIAAKLYYDMGVSYKGNFYLSCITTAQNALYEYPYSVWREDFSLYILRAKYKIADQSVYEKQADRYRETLDEYYAFKNDYPESNHLKEVERIGQDVQKKLQAFAE